MKGEYQVEVHWFLVGLGTDAKARMIEAQIRKEIVSNANQSSKLELTTNGSSPVNPISQSSATVNFRIFAQAKPEQNLSAQQLFRPCFVAIMEDYLGTTPHLDIRQWLPKHVLSTVFFRNLKSTARSTNRQVRMLKLLRHQKQKSGQNKQPSQLHSQDFLNMSNDLRRKVN